MTPQMGKLRAYLQLVRFPAVFTAMADIFLGFLLVRGTFVPIYGFVLLLLASSSLYLAGMVFNDVFDRQIDARERPRRPIPSGRVSLKAAVGLGMLFVLAGLGAAGVAGRQSLLVAIVLTFFIFLYDGFLKRTPLGPVAMGICRLLNVLLGASFIGPDGIFAMHLSWTDVRLPPVLAKPQLPVAACLGVFVAGVTWFARREAQESSRAHLAGATAVVNLGLGGLIVLLIGLPGLLLPWLSPGETDGRGIVMAIVIIALILNRRLIAAIFDPVPQKVQPAVKTLLLSIIVLDAILVFFHTNSPQHAIATALLVIPAIVLGRWIFVT
jgi:4-hydroxybenzoate polyprenyltransferase